MEAGGWYSQLSKPLLEDEQMGLDVLSLALKGGVTYQYPMSKNKDHLVGKLTWCHPPPGFWQSWQEEVTQHKTSYLKTSAKILN